MKNRSEFMKLDDYLNGDLLNVRYILKSDDVTKGKKGVLRR